MKKSKLNIKELKQTTAITPLAAEQMRFAIGGNFRTVGGTTSDTADTDQ